MSETFLEKKYAVEAERARRHSDLESFSGRGAWIDRVLGLFEKRGYKFVSLAEAQSDPAYHTPEIFAMPYGWMWGYRWAHELHVKVDGSREPEAPDWVMNYK